MKTAKLGDYLFWEGKLAKIVATSNNPMVCIELTRLMICPFCGKDIGLEQFWVTPNSPLFQEKAEPIQSIEIK